ncbi:MoaD/ThiS family protein [Desulfallas sp. Bu1-1]|uniref:MoaD/ThiS family protein n=1 Tax=Desulfallas sp. Bu1-1 TaxID=2787620 RepID=UPI0018A104BB|nr:MoaD/ThiS family protein [Desulfallas sp. Bu1-1]MBF7084039.1 MoaD/ThiS family protein [Desulfallas sp. Bu1-1]
MAAQNGEVEVRAFSFLKLEFDRRGWPFPMTVKLERECTALELAEKLELPRDKIEAVFINGIAGPLDRVVRPGDRVAFVPPGTPGPYRVILGMVNPSGGKGPEEPRKK